MAKMLRIIPAGARVPVVTCRSRQSILESKSGQLEPYDSISLSSLSLTTV